MSGFPEALIATANPPFDVIAAVAPAADERAGTPRERASGNAGVSGDADVSQPVVKSPGLRLRLRAPAFGDMTTSATSARRFRHNTLKRCNSRPDFPSRRLVVSRSLAGVSDRALHGSSEPAIRGVPRHHGRIEVGRHDEARDRDEGGDSAAPAARADDERPGARKFRRNTLK